MCVTLRVCEGADSRSHRATSAARMDTAISSQLSRGQEQVLHHEVPHDEGLAAERGQQRVVPSSGHSREREEHARD